MKASLWIVGSLWSLIAFSWLPEAPDASGGNVKAPAITVYEPIPYGEAPLATLTAPPAPTTTTTTVWIEPKPKTECHAALQIALDVGWPAKEMATLARVLWRESRCSFGPVLNPDDPMSGSYGLMQINGFWCKPTKSNPVPWLQQRKIVTECVDLYGAETNLQAGLAIWRNSGWHPWGIK
jgi:hypothetical protein